MGNIKDFYKRQINIAIDYIEGNYSKKISIPELASEAAFSEFHFHRIFKAVTNETVNSYIKRIKMGKASRSLLTTDRTITDIAMELGYNSSANFSRDFKEYYQCSPSELKKEQTPPLKRDIAIKKNLNISYSGIETFDERFLIYKRISTGYNTVQINMAFKELLELIIRNNIDFSDVTSLGIGYDDPDYIEAEKCRYDACIALKEELTINGENINSKTFKGGKCAVFLFEGLAEDFFSAWDYIFREWVIRSSYIPENKPHFEEYLISDNYKKGIFKAKLCLPVRKN